jgi:hypothetical protein
MKPILCTYRSTAAPARVWEFASDFARAPERIRAITKVDMLTPGPVAVGTRFKEWRGKHAVEMEIAAWAPPRSYQVRGFAAGTEFLSEIRCPADGSGTRLELEIRMIPRTFGAKLLSPLLALAAKLMAKSCAKDLADIAAAAERGGATG